MDKQKIGLEKFYSGAIDWHGSVSVAIDVIEKVIIHQQKGNEHTYSMNYNEWTYNYLGKIYHQNEANQNYQKSKMFFEYLYSIFLKVEDGFIRLKSMSELLKLHFLKDIEECFAVFSVLMVTYPYSNFDGNQIRHVRSEFTAKLQNLLERIGLMQR